MIEIETRLTQMGEGKLIVHSSWLIGHREEDKHKWEKIHTDGEDSAERMAHSEREKIYTDREAERIAHGA